MIHARSDYDRIQDPAIGDPSLLSTGSTPIAEDEPVFLVRARDIAFCDTLTAWIQSHINHGGDAAMVTAVASHLGSAIAWRQRNAVKVADAPESALKYQKRSDDE